MTVTLLAADDEGEEFDAPEVRSPSSVFEGIAERAPREGLIRSVSFEMRADPAGDGLSFSGYAAVFNSPTRIDSWEGQFYEVIARGAFKKTLRENTPVLMFNHGQHGFFGDMPLGKITSAREDEHGVFIEARLSDNWFVAPIRDAIRDEAISGMSFRFTVVKDSWDNKDGDVPLRTLREIKVPELGPVVFPAYTDTTATVRSMPPALREALLLGTPDEAAREGTSDVAAAREAGTATPRIPLQERRRRAAVIRGVIK